MNNDGSQQSTAAPAHLTKVRPYGLIDDRWSPQQYQVGSKAKEARIESALVLTRDDRARKSSITDIYTLTLQLLEPLK